MSTLNWVDFIFLAIFFFSVVKGFAKGVILEVVSLGMLILSLGVAILFAKPLANYCLNYPVVANLLNQASHATGVDASHAAYYLGIGLSFALLFGLTISLGALISSIVFVAFQFGLIGLGNRLLGGVFGLLRGYFICLVIIFVIQMTALSEKFSWHNSQIVNAYQPSVVWLSHLVTPSLSDVRQEINKRVEDAEELIQSTLNLIK